MKLLPLVLATPLFAFAQPAGEVRHGTWEDGTTVVWQCAPRMTGQIQIGVISKTGEKYQATIFCGPLT